MPSTPVYALPYPASTDPADVPADMQRLADRIEAAIAPGNADREVPVWDNGTKTWKPSAAGAASQVFGFDATGLAGFFGGMQRIVDYVVPSAVAYVDFSSLPQTFLHLLLFWAGGSDYASNSYAKVMAGYNGDASAHFYYQNLQGAGGTPSASITNAVAPGMIGITAAQGSPNGGAGFLLLPNYRVSGAFYKQWLAVSGTLGGGGFANVLGGLWATAGGPAINRIILQPDTGNWVTNTRFTIYGIS
jgi:hypothetical protein